MPRFLIHHASEGSRVFELLGDRPIVVGRAKSSNLVLDNASISRQHAVVRATPDGRWQIIDRGAANPVKVNGEPVKKSVSNRPNNRCQSRSASRSMAIRLPCCWRAAYAPYPLCCSSRLFY